MGEHTPLHEDWFNWPVQIGEHEPETRYTPKGNMLGGCLCGWRSRRFTRNPLRSWHEHVQREQAKAA
jgi:hypothetical protein